MKVVVVENYLQSKSGFIYAEIMKRVLLVLAVGLFVGLQIGLNPSGAAASTSQNNKWDKVASQITQLIDKAEKQIDAGQMDQAADTLRKARYDVFVRKGMETAISSEVSGGEANNIIMDFGLATQNIRQGNVEQAHKTLKALSDQIQKSTKSLTGQSGEAQSLSPGKWGQIAKTMIGLLEESKKLIEDGKGEEAKDKVNEAYYGHYEVTGFEKVTMARISGSHVAKMEMQFGLIKQAMTKGEVKKAVEMLEELEPWLIEDANTLDGYDGATGETGQSSAQTTVFFGSFTIILREGLEAMLVVAAVITYLIKSGNRSKIRVVWGGAILALVLSGVMAVVISSLTSMAGKSQELIEGITALFAVAMLIYVSNWMIGKSDAAVWDRYIKTKTDDSLSRGSLLSLAFVAFLAVLREGAETILFYQPILAIAGDDTYMVWLGLALGLLCLVIIYVLYRVFSWRIPLRPFFIFTSVLLALMAVSFTGSGIRELQEADVVSITPIDWMFTIDILGVFPRVENLTAQVVVLAIIVGLFWYAHSKSKRAVQNKSDKPQQIQAEESSAVQ